MMMPLWVFLTQYIHLINSVELGVHLDGETNYCNLESDENVADREKVGDFNSQDD